MAQDLGPDIFVRQSRALQRRRDQQGTLRKIKVPSMVVGGAHDSLVPVKRQAFMAGLIPGATFHQIDNAGHLPTLEAPGECLDLIFAWLKAPMPVA